MDSFLKGDIEVEATATPKAEKKPVKKVQKKSEGEEDFDDLKGDDEIPF